MTQTRFLLAGLLSLPSILFAADNGPYVPMTVRPPEPMREFRGAWIATVANIDWPSKPGLSTADQKAELVRLLDQAAQLKFNAVIFQVRPLSDAVYASSNEPWSEYLTGTMGKPPEPFFDPLALAVDEAHRRGLELHAWFNPFRASHPQAKSPPAANHISRTRPDLIRHYGNQLWLDPGEPDARARVLAVVTDVVKRYDVDGVQFDDYFYPYPEKDSSGRDRFYPDDISWRQYGVHSGLSREDWRRENVNKLIQNVYQSIRAVKPRVQFGVSPFGIWRPQNPPQIRGMDAYQKLYADSRKWLANGWLDYCAPQLYWSSAQREQSFPVLLRWWREQNVKGRHVWPGLNDAGVGDKFESPEIGRQIQTAREQSARGEIHYHLRSVLENPTLAGIVRAAYAQPALVPTTPWLDSMPPDTPRLTVTVENHSGPRAHWETSGGEPARWWLLQVRTHDVWTTEVLPPHQADRVFDGSGPDAICVRAVDRLGNLSDPAAVVKRQFPPVREKRPMVSEGL